MEQSAAKQADRGNHPLAGRGDVNVNSSFDVAGTLQLNASMRCDKVYPPSHPRYGYGPKNHIYAILIWMSAGADGLLRSENVVLRGGAIHNNGWRMLSG
ncbi:MAG: hypothetical protein LBU37_10265 [Tannerellaceae bacterium]|jgi:hypothetical protein|nr:hypothetical protein [Tannerellaceae bacterium]